VDIILRFSSSAICAISLQYAWDNDAQNAVLHRKITIRYKNIAECVQIRLYRCGVGHT